MVTTRPAPSAPRARVGPPREPALAAVRRGTAGAWDRVLTEYEPLVRRTAARQGLSECERDDVVQTVWLRLLTNVDSIRDDATLPAWLITTAQREAWAAGRRRRREAPSEEPVSERLAADHEEPADVVDRALGVRRLRPCIAALPDRERRLVEALLDPREPSYREISRSLSMPIGAIGPVRRRALLRLRSLMEAAEVAGRR